jgi:hypothetical protein
LSWQLTIPVLKLLFSVGAPCSQNFRSEYASLIVFFRVSYLAGFSCIVFPFFNDKKTVASLIVALTHANKNYAALHQLGASQCINLFEKT